MNEQISLFQPSNINDLEVVQVQFLDKTYTCVEELFKGYNHLYAITFSYGLDFIRKISGYFDTTEIILGCEAIVKFDLKTIMAFQTKVLEKISKHKDLIQKVEEGALSFWVAKEILSHEKVFILTSNTGKTRVITGSVNFSARPFSGKQRENIEVFDNDGAAFDFYINEFETLKEFSTNEIVKESLYVNASTDPEKAIEAIPIIKEVKVNKAGIVLDNDNTDNDSVEFVFNLQSASSKYTSIIPKLQTQNGKTLITSNSVQELLRKHRSILHEQTTKQIINPQFKINYSEGTATFNNKQFDFDIDLKEVTKDLEYIGEYFAGFDDFIGNVEKEKSKYFRLLNYMLLSPFIAQLRQEAYKTDFSIHSFPLFAVINGPKSAGKSSFVDTVQALMFGKSLGGVDTSFFTKTGIAKALCDCTGVPLHIEDISKDRFVSNAGEIIKSENSVLRQHLNNHPVFIITSNEISNIKSDFVKRVYYSSIDITLTNDSAVSKHKKAVEIRKKISTAFYREYFKRMFVKVSNLIEDMHNFVLDETNEGWKPDVFLLSSETIIEIYKDCNIAPPSFVTLVNYSDYFGHNDIAESIRDKIRFEWEHNRSAFKILKKQNLLEYTAGEHKYEADRIKEAMPEKLLAKCSGTKVVIQLDEAQKFFGVHFKKGLF